MVASAFFCKAESSATFTVNTRSEPSLPDAASAFTSLKAQSRYQSGGVPASLCSTEEAGLRRASATWFSFM